MNPSGRNSDRECGPPSRSLHSKGSMAKCLVVIKYACIYYFKGGRIQLIPPDFTRKHKVSVLPLIDLFSGRIGRNQ